MKTSDKICKVKNIKNKTVYEIAEETGLTEAYVRLLLRQKDLKYKRKHREHPNRYNWELLNNIDTTKYTSFELAEMLGCSASAVRMRRKQFDLKSAGRAILKHKHNERIEVALDLVRDKPNKTISQISLEAGIGYDTVKMRLKEGEYKKSVRYDWAKIDKECGGKLTIREVCRKYDILSRTVRNARYKGKLRLRNAEPNERARKNEYDWSKIDKECGGKLTVREICEKYDILQGTVYNAKHRGKVRVLESRFA